MTDLGWVKPLAEVVIRKLGISERNLIFRRPDPDLAGYAMTIDLNPPLARRALEQAVRSLTTEQKLQLAALTSFEYGASFELTEGIYRSLGIKRSDLHAFMLVDYGAIVGLYHMVWAVLKARKDAPTLAETKESLGPSFGPNLQLEAVADAIRMTTDTEKIQRLNALSKDIVAASHGKPTSSSKIDGEWHGWLSPPDLCE
jgi:hypothetical protein